MPATKIETGVYIELKRLRLSPIARKHRPEKTASLARSIKDLNQQIEDIIVCPQDEAAGQASPLFDVLAGVGRKEAEESLGWEKGRCTIMYGLSPYEKLKVTLDENEERQATGPLDDARIYQAMLKAEEGMTQEKLANKLGMKRSTLADYLAIAHLPAPVQEFVVRTTNLGLAHLLQICRLKTPEAQIDLAKKADEEGWTVGKLKGEVNKRLKSPEHPPLQKGGGGKSPPADPYAELWSGVRDRIGASCQEAWQIGYVPFKSMTGTELTWMFALMNRNKVSPQRISAWLKQLAKGIDDAHLPDPDVERRKAEQAREAKEQKQIKTMQKLQAKAAEAVGQVLAMGPEKIKAIQDQTRKAAELWMPKTSQEVKEMKASPLNYKLPNTQEEWKEVEALAPQGPGAVYEWMLGPENYYTKKAAKLTWQDLEYPDALTGCRKLIENLHKGRSSQPVAPAGDVNQSAPPPAPVPAPAKAKSLLDDLDPEIRAMVEEDMKLGRLP